MNNKQNNNNCYVFSQATMDQALKEWVSQESEKHPKNHESYSITVVAMPWFLKHFTHGSSIYTFTHKDLLTELDLWKSTQLEMYPHQKKRIEETCDQFTNFFQSDVVIQHKMSISS